MSLMVSLHLKNKKVLVVGGGNVAYRKVKQFLSEEADITVIAPDILEEIRNTSVKCINKTFEVQDVNGFVLIYAATNDALVNAQVVHAANSMNILCGSATECEEVSFSSLQQKQLSHGQLAVSTQGLAPGMTKEMLIAFEETWKQKFEKKLELLQTIKDMLPKQTYRNIRKVISKFPYEKLTQVHNILIRKKVIVYLYHGGADETIIRKDLPSFIDTLGIEKAVCIPCLCAIHAQKQYQNEFKEEFTLDEILLLASNLEEVSFMFEIVMVQKGRYYQKLSSLCNQYGEILPFWLTCEMIDNYVSETFSRYPDEVCVFVLHSRNEYFQSICQKYHAVCIGIKDEINIENKKLHIIPVFITKGNHMKYNVLHGKNSLCEHLRQKGYHITIEEMALIEQDWVIKAFQDHVREFIDYKK